jgi:hypothetical protein
MRDLFFYYMLSIDNKIKLRKKSFVTLKWISYKTSVMVSDT